MDMVFPGRTEKKLAKKEKAAEKAAKFHEWEDDWTRKRRAADDEKARKVQKARAKEEAQKTDYERNQPKYEVWANKDEKGKMMIDRYNLHDNRSSEEKQQERQAAREAVRPSAMIASKIRVPTTGTGSTVYTPKVSSPVNTAPAGASKTHPGTDLPRPSAFSSTTVELRYKNNVCYWPASMVTHENLVDRFGLKKPAMRLASIPKGPLAIKFKPQADGSFQVQGGQAYVCFNLKDSAQKIRAETGLDESALSFEQKVERFLTMATFSRGEIMKGSTMSADKMVREESLQFTPEGRFCYKEFRGYKNVEGSLKQQLMLVGKYKLKNKHQSVHLVFDKDKTKKKAKPGEERSQDRVAERKLAYQKWWIPGDGTLQCLADQSIRFK